MLIANGLVNSKLLELFEVMSWSTWRWFHEKTIINTEKNINSCGQCQNVADLLKIEFLASPRMKCSVIWLRARRLIVFNSVVESIENSGQIHVIIGPNRDYNMNHWVALAYGKFSDHCSQKKEYYMIIWLFTVADCYAS